jgi:arylsulfatase A-like enzyme
MRTALTFHLRGSTIIGCFIALILFAATTVSLGQSLNIVYIMTDDMGYGDLSCYGRKDFQTPHIDKLASEGMKFTNAYSGGPLCTPTRASFLTGRYPARTPVGLIEPLTGQPSDTTHGLTPAYPSVAKLLGASGYETALIGKWHLGSQPHHSPIKNGFDYFYGFRSGAVDYVSHRGTDGIHDFYENDLPVYPEGYLTDLIADKAVEFIHGKHSKPFFLSINFNAPHWPWQKAGDAAYADATKFREGGSPATYHEMMKSLDDGVGRIMKSLEAKGLRENTIVVFTNDNGGERYSDSGGLTKGKATVWEGGIKVPAIVRWPGKIKQGSLTDQIIITMDWTATFLSVARAKVPPGFALDGIDLMPIMTGKTKVVPRTLYWRLTQRQNEKAVRKGEWKYLVDATGEYLFNLDNDPSERKNLKDENPDVFNSLRQKYAAWEKTVLEPIKL